MVKLTSSSFFLILTGILIFGTSVKSSYTRGLIQYLKRESKLFQVMFIIDNRFAQNSSLTANRLITDVSKHFPSMSMGLNEFQLKEIKNFPFLLRQPKRTTLFIMIIDISRADIWNDVFVTLQQLRELSNGFPYPKCMINLFPEAKINSTKRALEFFWVRDFLDIEVLEHLERKENRLTERGGSIHMLHEIKTFSKKYRVKNVTAQTRWFPDKLQNLHGHKLKFLLINNIRRSSNEIEKLEKLANLLSSSLHASVNIVITNHESVHRRVEKNLQKHKAEMLLNSVHVMIHNDRWSDQKIRIFELVTAKAVVPKSLRLSKVVIFSEDLVIMIVATTLAIFVLRIAAFIMKFNKNTWEIFLISQIIIGMSVIREPSKSTERIVFGILMLSCIVYSSYIYSVILDISFSSEHQISSLEELANSSLTHMTEDFVNKSLLSSSVSYIQRLGMRTIKFPAGWIGDDCLKYMTKYENITCILLKAENYMQNFRKGGQELNIKLLKEPVAFYVQNWFARRGSPFVDHFNKIILRASEAGLLSDFFVNYVTKPSKLSPPEQIGKEKLFFILSYLLVIGYSLAITVFIIEVAHSFSWRKVRSFCNR